MCSCFRLWTRTCGERFIRTLGVKTFEEDGEVWQSHRWTRASLFLERSKIKPALRVVSGARDKHLFMSGLILVIYLHEYFYLVCSYVWTQYALTLEIHHSVPTTCFTTHDLTTIFTWQINQRPRMMEHLFGIRIQKLPVQCCCTSLQHKQSERK